MLITYYNPKLPIIVVADGSNYGVGAVLTHIFPYGSNLKEALAMIYAVKKFHKYINGCHFTLLIDHKPLFSIFALKRHSNVLSETCAALGNHPLRI